MSQAMNHGAFRQMFAQDRLTLGVFMPIEAFDGDFSKQEEQVRLVKYADTSGFAALWFQDVTLRDPDFGDARTKYDSFVYMTYLMAHTQRIAFATASTVLTHRHPLRLAKEVNTLDQLSHGRFVMGISSGDRPIDFAGYGLDHETRGERFREAFAFYKGITTPPFQGVSSPLGTVPPGEMILQPLSYVPNLVVGNAQQTVDWIAEHGDGWMYYARPPYMQAHMIGEFRAKVEHYAPGVFKPFAQPLFINLLEDPQAPVTYLRAGFSAGREFLLRYLEELRNAGVNHVVLSIREQESTRPLAEVYQEIVEEVLPHYPLHRS
jgi:luciferase-type oxidoreductase